MQQGQTVHLPQLTTVNKGLIIATVAFFLLNTVMEKALGVGLLQYMGLSLSMFSQGHLYQVLTYPFVSHQLLGVVFSCLIVWFIGSELEEMWGVQQYVFILLVSVLFAALSYLLVVALFFTQSAVFHMPLYGLAGVSASLCLMYAVFYPDRQFIFMFLFPMKAKYFCMLLIAISLYQGLFTTAGAGAWGHLGAMLGAYLGHRLLGVHQVRRWVLSTGFSLSSIKHKQKQFQRQKRAQRSNLRVVKEEDEDHGPGRDDSNHHQPPKYWQ